MQYFDKGIDFLDNLMVKTFDILTLGYFNWQNS